MKYALAAIAVFGFAFAAAAADLIQWAPPPPETYVDGGKFCQQNADCQSGYCLADEQEKGHGLCRGTKYPGFGCMTLYDKEKGVTKYCADE